MLKGFGSQLRLDLSKAGMTLFAIGGGLRSRTTVVVSRTFAGTAPDSPERLLAEVRLGLSEVKYSRRPVTMILADEWLRLFIVTPPRNASRLEDCKVAAAMRFQELYGEPVTDWLLEADWDAYRPMLACAIPRELDTALQQIAAEHALELIGIVPHFVAAWNQWRDHLQASAWFGVVHNNVLTLGMPDQKSNRRLCAVRATTLPAAAAQDAQSLVQHTEREALRLNLPMPSRMQLCGDVPSPWIASATRPLICTRLDGTRPASGQPRRFARIALALKGRASIRIDFAPRTVQRAIFHASPLTWLIGALGFALCLSVGAASWNVEKDIRARGAELDGVHARQSLTADRLMRRSLVRPSTISAAHAVAVNQAVAQLNLPWRDVLDAVEAATPGTIALLALEPDAKKQLVRGLAEAKDSETMIAYIEQLKQQPFFASVVLTRHEINEQDPNKPFRFQFEAHWGREGRA